MSQNKKMISEQGFTLVEMALVIVIGGVMLSLLGSALISFQKKNQIRITEHRIDTVNEALARYLSINRRYPCPANRTANLDDADFGRTADTNNCQNPATGVADDGAVKIGAVPTRTLNLPDEYATDSWGRRFTYAVTEALATSGSYNADGGAITVNDLNGNSVIQPAGTAHYIIASHGATGMGGFTFNGTTQYTACSAAFGRDSENCNDDATFIASLVTSEATGANFYDDYLYAQGRTAPNFAVPEGAVVAFDGGCPTGWEFYTPAQGRFIIGVTNAGSSVAIPQTALITPGGGANFVSPTRGNASAGDQEANIPPHVALTFCRKLAD